MLSISISRGKVDTPESARRAFDTLGLDDRNSIPDVIGDERLAAEGSILGRIDPLCSVSTLPVAAPTTPAARKPKPVKPKVDKFVQSQLEDVAVIFKHLNGESIDCFPLWKRDGNKVFPTYAGAVNLLGLLKMTTETISVRESLINKHHFPKRVYHSVVRVHYAGRSRFGASSSQHRDVSIRLAMRNGVSQLVA